tara:strand:+ start:173 stop:442 length:270 start_codon:yes stop_codon:yes gene_type:complete
MNLNSETKKTIFKKFGQTESDTGSPESQIAIFTERINNLTEYLKTSKKDKSTKRSLVLIVGKRRRMLEYLKKKNIERYRSIVKDLKLRK